MEFIERVEAIKTNHKLEDIAKKLNAVVKEGSYYKMNCPLNENEPNRVLDTKRSLVINPLKEIFYCFECHSSGDIVSFVSKFYKKSPLEACEMLEKGIV